MLKDYEVRPILALSEPVPIFHFMRIHRQYIARER